MKWMIKNSAGKQDSMLTFAFGGFIVTSIVVVLAFLGDFSIGSFSFKLNLSASHVGLLTLFLGATLTAYVSRRNKKLDGEIELEKIRLQKLYCPKCQNEKKELESGV